MLGRRKLEEADVGEAQLDAWYLLEHATRMSRADYFKEPKKELTKELEKWFVEYVTAEKIDDGLFSEEEAEFSEEQKYFKRFDKMKELLSERFLNLNEGYMDRFLDKHYQDIFGEDR